MRYKKIYQEQDKTKPLEECLSSPIFHLQIFSNLQFHKIKLHLQMILLLKEKKQSDDSFEFLLYLLQTIRYYHHLHQLLFILTNAHIAPHEFFNYCFSLQRCFCFLLLFSKSHIKISQLIILGIYFQEEFSSIPLIVSCPNPHLNLLKCFL